MEPAGWTTTRAFRNSDRRQEPALDPIGRLMLAVLEDAILTFQGGLRSKCPVRRSRFHEVECWIRSRDLDSPFAFETVCESLRLDPDCIRQGLLQLRRRTLENPARRPRVRLRRTALEQSDTRARALAG